MGLYIHTDADARAPKRKPLTHPLHIALACRKYSSVLPDTPADSAAIQLTRALHQRRQVVSGAFIDAQTAGTIPPLPRRTCTRIPQAGAHIKFLGPLYTIIKTWCVIGVNAIAKYSTPNPHTP